MTMPKKKSRSVTVDGRAYRFMVRDPYGDGRVEFIVEDIERPGEKRSLRTVVDPYYTPKGGIGKPQAAALIRAGIQAGWNPAVIGLTLDGLAASWVLEDESRPKIRVRSVDHLIADALAAGDFDRANRALGLRQAFHWDATTLLAVARVTRPYAPLLSERAAFVDMTYDILCGRGMALALNVLKRREKLTPTSMTDEAKP